MIKSVNLNKHNITLLLNETEDLEAVINPVNTTESKALTWTSSDDKIVSVNDGVISAHSRGTVTITVTASNNKTDECEVTVIDPKVLSITANDYNVNVDRGEFDIEYSILDQDNPTYTVEFISGNDNIISVDKQGHVSIKNPGETTITISALGVEKVINVNVYKVINNINLTKIEKPIAYEKANTNIETNSEGVIIKGAYWYLDDDDWIENGPVESFEKDKRYFLRVEIELENYYVLSTNFNERNITLNEKGLRKEFVNNANDIRIYYEANLPAISEKPVIKVKNGNNNTLNISWNKVRFARKYIIYQSTDNKKWTNIGSTTDLTYVAVNLTYGKKYFYKVKAANDISNKTSAVVNAKTTPNKVSNLTIKSAETNNVKLTWNKVKVTGYEIYNSTDNKKWTKVAIITKNDTLEYNNKKLKANKTYYFKVRAYKTVSGKKIYGKYSEVVSTKTAPEKPVVTLKLKDYNAMNLVIGSSKGANKYVVEKSLDGTTYELVEELPNEGTLVQESQTVGSTYYFRVKACNSKENCSKWVSVNLKQTTKTPKVTLTTKSKKVIATLGSVNESDGYQLYGSTKKSGKYSLLHEFSSEEELLEYTQKTKKGITYYYKVRSFKVVDVSRVYSPYSKVKSIKSK